ncbi:MAG: diguanylate cyclase [Pseudomonadota bacterium]
MIPEITPWLPHRLARILVVDDERTNLLLLRGILKGDYEVFTAQSGEEALKLAALQQPEVILLDVIMPGLDGYEVCTRLKENSLTQDSLVLFISGLNSPAEEAKGLAAGAIDSLPKPINPALVKARVRNYVELKQQRDLLKHLAALDGLTGLANRRHFEETLSRTWRHAILAGQPLGLILYDIDLFHAYNQHTGHAQADKCLKNIAKLSKKALDPGSGLIARYHNDEFAALLPNTDAQAVTRMAESLIQIVQSAAIPHPASPLGQITISLGVIAGKPTPTLSISTFVDQAISHLTEARQNGGNRWVA